MLFCFFSNFPLSLPSPLLHPPGDHGRVQFCLSVTTVGSHGFVPGTADGSGISGTLGELAQHPQGGEWDAGRLHCCYT